MLEDVKLALRITNTAYDPDVLDLIDEARADLILAGISSVVVNEEKEVDPLIKRAIKTYAKAHFGIDNPQADRFHDSYVMLKQHLALSGDYNVYPLE